MFFAPLHLFRAFKMLFGYIWILSILPLSLPAQITDSFSDGNISANPTWTGDTNKYKINSVLQLQLNGASVSDTACISLRSPAIGNTEWGFWVKMGFSPSNSNYIKVYLVSNNPNLKGALSGYYVRIGETGSLDGVDLYRQNAKTSSKIIDGGSGRAAKANTPLRVKVTRDKDGNWDLYSDTSGAYKFHHEGAAYDNTYVSSAFMGFACRYTKSSRTKFFIDDLYVKPLVADTIPPILDSLKITDNLHLNLYFNELLKSSPASKAGNYVINNSIGPCLKAAPDSDDNSIVRLTLQNALQNGMRYTLSLYNISDTSGIAVKQSDTVSFVYEAPYFPKPGEIVINEIFPNPANAKSLPNTEFVELYNPTDQFISLANWKFTDSVTFGLMPSFKLKPKSFLILCAASDTISLKKFGTTMGLKSFPSLNNSGDNLYLLNEKNQLMDEVSYSDSWYGDASKASGGWTLERRSPTETYCDLSANWTGAVDPAGGTPGRSNSMFSTQKDTSKIYIVKCSVKAPDQLFISFSGTIDTASLSLKSFLVVESSVNPKKLKFNRDRRSVTLFFKDKFIPGDLYTLKCIDIKNCKGSKSLLSEHFAIGVPPVKGNVVINEIMPDPDPPLKLPNAEYVELYNTGNKCLELGGMTLKDPGTASRLDSTILYPGEYLILCSTSNIGLFKSFGRVIGLANFTSLNNSGDTISLLSQSGALLEKLVYSDAWYGGVDKKQGGFSLEKIDPLYACSGSFNWSGSTDNTGGTPGRKNSIYGIVNDTAYFRATEATLSDSVTLQVAFNRELDSSSVKSTTQFSVSPKLEILSLATTGQTVILKLKAKAQHLITYTLKLGPAIKDCAGKSIFNSSLPFGWPEQPGYKDLVVNEVLFNPYTYGSDFVEIYNRSGKIIDCKELSLANGDYDKDSSKVLKLSAVPLLIYPGEYKAFSENPSYICETYNCKAGNSVYKCDIPTYADDKGSVILLGRKGFTIDRFNYSEKMQFPLLGSNDGVALERVGFERPTDDSTNWHSASEAAGFATPGYINSQFQQNAFAQNEISLENEVFSPDNDGFRDNLTLHYHFSGNGLLANIRILNDKGFEVRTLSGSTYIVGEGSVSWDGIMDNGRKAPIGPYIIFVQTTDPAGSVNTYKKVCVVGGKLE